MLRLIEVSVKIHPPVPVQAACTGLYNFHDDKRTQKAKPFMSWSSWSVALCKVTDTR